MTDALQVWWQGLDSRQRRSYTYGFWIVVVFVVVFGFLVPLWKAHAEVSRKLTVRQDRLVQMVRLEREALTRRDSGFRRPTGRGLGAQTPISFIEKIASETGIKEKLTNVRPGPQSRHGNHKYGKVTFQMSGIGSGELVDLMFKLEKSGYDVRVLRFESNRKTRGKVNLQIEVELEMLL